MTVPRVFQKSSSDSNSLSFAFTLPVQRKTLPFNSNASKKQLHAPLTTLQELKDVKKSAKPNALTNILNGQFRGKEMEVNTTQNNYYVKTLSLVGAPLNRSSKINKGVSVSPFGASTVIVRPRLGWKGKPRENALNKAMSPVEKFQTQSSFRGNAPLDEEIIVMGEPLIFTKGNRKLSYASTPTAQKGNVSSDIRGESTSKVDTHYNSSRAHFHHPAAPIQAKGVRVPGAQLTNQSPVHVDFYSNITVSNVSKAQLTEGPENDLSKPYDNLPKGIHNNGSNQQPNQLPTQPSNANPAGNQVEEEDGYEIEGITDHGRHSNENVYPTNSDEEPLRQETFGHQSTISEQNQTELVYQNDHESIGGQGFGDSINSTNFGNNATINERYENQENKAVNTDELTEGREENCTALQEESYGPADEEMDNTQRINDNPSNLEQNQESKDDEQFAAGNPVTPLSNRRYVPVDEFGSPLYGAETGNRTLHTNNVCI